MLLALLLVAFSAVQISPGTKGDGDEKALGMFTSGRMKFVRYETSETTIRTYDDTAIVTGGLRRARVIAGASAEDDWRFTKVYLHREIFGRRVRELAHAEVIDLCGASHKSTSSASSRSIAPAASCSSI